VSQRNRCRAQISRYRGKLQRTPDLDPKLIIRLVCLLFDQEEKWLLNEISWMLLRRLLGRVPSSPVRHFTLSTIRRDMRSGGIDTVAFVMIYVTNACDFMGSYLPI
jgi:hypothetical protein